MNNAGTVYVGCKKCRGHLTLIDMDTNKKRREWRYDFTTSLLEWMAGVVECPKCGTPRRNIVNGCPVGQDNLHAVVIDNNR